MNRSILRTKYGWLVGLLVLTLDVGCSNPTWAQVGSMVEQHSEVSLPLCYMRLANGSFMDLHTLCGRNTSIDANEPQQISGTQPSSASDDDDNNEPSTQPTPGEPQTASSQPQRGSRRPARTQPSAAANTASTQLTPNGNQPQRKSGVSNAQSVPANTFSPTVPQAAPTEPSGVNIEY